MSTSPKVRPSSEVPSGPTKALPFRVGDKVSSETGPISKVNAKTTVKATNGTASHQEDPAIRGETFQGHWRQMRGITSMDTVPSGDDIVAVVNLLSQMTSLLQMELEAERQNNSLPYLKEDCDPLESIREPNSMPCLDLLLSDNILSHVLATSRMPIEDRHANQLRLLQLIVYETLLASDQAQTLLSHQPFLKPLLELLHHFKDSTAMSPNSRLGNNSEDKSSVSSKDAELHLVLVLNQLCSKLMENLDLLRFFFMASTDGDDYESKINGESKDGFLIFSILINFLHRDDHAGQLARDALLHCMSLSKKSEAVGNYIAKRSNFCPVLATGLSGLYSLLPRRLPEAWMADANFHRISEVDLVARQVPELSAFVASLQFCDAVINVAHKNVRDHLLGLIYMGFLVPVMGPAITQSSEDEIISTTCYLELFIRKITEPMLLSVFLKFIFIESCDDRNISDVLTIRISSQSKLCQVTLSLFETLLNLHCEDIFLWLVFRHLIPLRHLIPSQRDQIRKPDLHGRAAEKLLALIPICVQEARHAMEASSNPSRQSGAKATTPSAKGLAQMFGRRGSNSSQGSLTTSTPAQAFSTYLAEAKHLVRQSHEASTTWLYPYDGLTPPPNAFMDSSGANESSNPDSEDLPESVATSAPKADDVLCDTLTNPNAGDNSITPSSGYTSLAQLPPSPASMSGPVSLTADEERDFWKLMKDPSSSEVRLGKVIQKMQFHDEISLSSHGNTSHTGSDITSYVHSPRDMNLSQNVTNDDIDLTVTSLGCFLDLLLEKVELMASNNLITNLLVTSILSRLASQPQPILRSVLLQPDVIFQPSVRGLYTAIASLKQKLDNIMPTLVGADEAIHLSRKFLMERTEDKKVEAKGRRKDSTTSMASTISHLGQEANRHRSSLSAAFTSIFRKKSGQVSIATGTNASPGTRPPAALNNSAPASILDASTDSDTGSVGAYNPLSKEVRMQAMAAVLLEEWLLELAAIAQEHSVLQKEQVLDLGMQFGTANLDAF